MRHVVVGGSSIYALVIDIKAFNESALFCCLSVLFLTADYNKRLEKMVSCLLLN